MHSEVAVAKQAAQQLRKTASWIEPLDDIETLDEETLEEYRRAHEALLRALNDWLEEQ